MPGLHRLIPVTRLATAILPAVLAPPPPAPAATFTVTSASDSGTGALRTAMNLANASPGLDTIEFNLPGPGPHGIQPLAELSTIAGPVILDGTTQPGYADSPVIVLDGIRLTYNTALLRITAGGTTLRGLVLRSCYGFSNDPPIPFGWAIFLKALAKAVPALDRGQAQSGCKALRSFVVAVGKLLARGTGPSSLARSVTDDANAIVATLGCAA